MPGEDFGTSEYLGYQEQDDETRHIEAVIAEEAYIRWQENGRDDDLERVNERLFEEFEQKRDLKDGDPGKPAWVTGVQQTVERRLQGDV